jgi:ABC-2 type transport system permease protein
MTGTWALLRLALRRDRILLPAWIIGPAAMVTISVSATTGLYPTAASRVAAANTINATAALVALYGRIYDPTSIGALSLVKMTAFGAALVGIIFVFVVVRHTRTEEETGRLELLAAGVVGRSAPLAAGLLTGILASLGLGVLTTWGLIAVGLPVRGSVVFGLAWLLSGVVFSSIAAVAAQTTTSHRSAIGIGMAAVGTSYALRAVGDLATNGPSPLSWLSPIGWSQQLRPFSGDRWIVALLPALASILLIQLAFWLRSRRDLDAGLWPDRIGPAVGDIASASGLAWRLQRGLFLAWLGGSVILGAVLGSAAKNVTGLLTSPQMQKYVTLLGGEQGLITAFLAAEVGIMGSILAAYAISTTSRLRAEESAGHGEAILATATSRISWALSHFAVALGGVTVVLLTSGAAIGLAHGISIGEPWQQTGRLMLATAAQAPAIWVLASLTLLLFGWLPRATTGAWGLLVGCVVIGEFGVLWQLPQWLLDLSPLAHSPKLPGGPVEALPLVLLTVTAAVIAAIGLVGWERRDLQT